MLLQPRQLPLHTSCRARVHRGPQLRTGSASIAVRNGSKNNSHMSAENSVPAKVLITDDAEAVKSAASGVKAFALDSVDLAGLDASVSEADVKVTKAASAETLYAILHHHFQFFLSFAAGRLQLR